MYFTIDTIENESLPSLDKVDLFTDGRRRAQTHSETEPPIERLGQKRKRKSKSKKPRKSKRGRRRKRKHDSDFESSESETEDLPERFNVRVAPADDPPSEEEFNSDSPDDRSNDESDDAERMEQSISHTCTKLIVEIPRCTSKLANTIVDHLVAFAGCSHHYDPLCDGFCIKQFATVRLPQNSSIPHIVRLQSIGYMAMERFENYARKEFHYNQRQKWLERRQLLRKIITGLNREVISLDSEDEEFERRNTTELEEAWSKEFGSTKPNLNWAMNDLARQLKPKTTWDIDSLIAVTKTLRLLNENTDVEVDLHPIKVHNLSGSIHLSLHGKPINKIKHMRFLTFARNTMKFQVYLLAPNYEGGDDSNVISESVVEAFVDNIWLPVIRDVLRDNKNETCRWPASYRVHKAKMQAPITAAVPVNSNVTIREQQILIPLSGKYIPKIWKEVKVKLADAFRTNDNQELQQLRGYRWVISGKNFKNTTSTEGLDGIMDTLGKDVFSFVFF